MSLEDVHALEERIRDLEGKVEYLLVQVVLAQGMHRLHYEQYNSSGLLGAYGQPPFVELDKTVTRYITEAYGPLPECPWPWLEEAIERGYNQRAADRRETFEARMRELQKDHERRGP